MLVSLHLYVCLHIYGEHTQMLIFSKIFESSFSVTLIVNSCKYLLFNQRRLKSFLISLSTEQEINFN